MTKLKILILEDNVDDVKLITRILTKSGIEFEYIHVQTKDEFEASVFVQVDLILADYNLPGYNATDALRLVKDIGIDVPFVIITGTASTEQALNCIELGAEDYVFKDRPERLSIAVARAIKQKELALDKHRLQIQQTNFIQNVSHELRTPLGLIIGHAEMMAEPDPELNLGPLNDIQKVSLEVICRRAAQMQRMISDIMILMELDSKQLDGGYAALNNLKEVSLSDAISRRIKDFAVIAQEKGISIITHTQDDVVIYSSDRLINSMIDNLVSNAIKFTISGSVTISLSKREKNVVLIVKDTGVGMMPKVVGTIFDRFCQLDGSSTRQHGGTGLGLSVVKEVVSSLHGTIEVESEPSVGSTFTITIPMEEK